MENNTSNLTHGGTETFCSNSITGRAKLGSTYGVVSLIIGVINVVTSPTAVAGNALVLAAIWRKPSLRTPSFILLAGLAFTDFCTGLFVQPVTAAYKFTVVANKQLHHCVISITYHIVKTYFPVVTIMTLTLMSIERWVHMKRRTFWTVRRVSIMYLLFLTVPVPLLTVTYLPSMTEGFKTFMSGLVSSLAATCCVATSVAYFGVFRIIRRHQSEIRASRLTQNAPLRSRIDLKKYQKSVYTILYIWALLLVTYIPGIIFYCITYVYNDDSETKMIFAGISGTVVNLSSSINPLVYCWRIANIRSEIRQLLKKVF